MKFIKDYQTEVLNEMTTNQTLTFNGDFYFVADGIDEDEVREALISRYAAKMNEYLYEPYGKARTAGLDAGEVISRVVHQFADQIEKDCETLCIEKPKRGIMIKKLYEGLDERYV
ncbi:MAG: hypothetical protein IJR34_07285 [Bacteroidales bacterium]|nr:hypothetical protein [Bacteroidales bacterium]